MSIILVDSYGESNQGSLYQMYGGSTIGVAQSFIGDGNTLNSCKFYLRKSGLPTGNAVAKIYAHSGTFGISSIPTGAALATSDVLDAATLTTSFQLILLSFTGVNQITLTAGIKYIISIEYSGGTNTNKVLVGIDITASTHPGNVSVLSVSWSAGATYDACFYVYADTTTPPSDPEAPPYSSAIPDVLSIAIPHSLKTTKIINGAWTAKMQILPDDYISAESYIDITDNGVREEYVVKKLEKIKLGGKYYYDVDLILNAMEELTAHKVEQFYFQKSVQDCAAFLLTNTQWVLGECDINEIIILESGSKISSLEGLNQLAEKCNGELYWHSKDRVVDIKREIGNITGLQLRHDKNCTEIKRIEDSSGLVTRIYPTGPDNFEINRLTLDDCEDETVWTPSGVGSVALSSNKRQGSSSVAIASSTLNETFIHNLGAGGVKNLSGYTKLKFWFYSTFANALGFTFGIGESAYTEHTVNTGALSANCWVEIELDLSTVADASKNAIRYLGFKNLTSGAVTASFDNIRAFDGEIYIDSPNIGLYKVAKEYVYNHSAKPEKIQFEVLIPASDDAFVSEDTVNTNYGTNGVVVVRNGAVPVDGISRKCYGYWKFPVGVIPSEADIVSATMHLNVTAVQGYAFDPWKDPPGASSVSTFQPTSDWNENTITWGNKPANDGVNINSWDFSATGEKDLILTSTFNAWIAGNNYGVVLITTQDKWINIASKENVLSKTYIRVVYTLLTDPSPVIEASARAYMALWDIPYLSFSGKTHDLSMVTEDTWKDETIGLGDTVKMYDSEIKDSEGKPLNVNIRVKSITRNILSPTDVDIELANKVYTFADLQARIYKQLKYAMPFNDNPRIIDASAVQEGYIGGSVNV